MKGDPPERVEYIGMKNLVDVLKDHVGLRDGKILLNVAGMMLIALVDINVFVMFKHVLKIYVKTGNGLIVGPAWGSLDDIVMGGVSASSLQISLSGGEEGGTVALFKGGSFF